jgi:hypothetical protein
MRLKELIAYLATKDSDAVAINGFGSAHSYRGWYEQLAFEPVNQTTAGEMLGHAKSALGKEFYGWKGGEYLMNGGSFVNIAKQGDCGSDDDITVERLDAMFNAPQQRTAEQSSRTLAWVGLTDAEVEEEWVKMCGPQRWAMHAVYARAIEAKLKAKNERLEKNT